MWKPPIWLHSPAGVGFRMSSGRMAFRYAISAALPFEARVTAPLFISSGDLIADRRYDRARAYAADGDLAAAADLYAQAVELEPRLCLGVVRARRDARGAGRLRRRDARRSSRRGAADPDDRHGAGLHLARLGAADPATQALHGYVRTLFDQYAPRFDRGACRT